MKRLQLLRWSNSVLSPRARTNVRLHQRLYAGLRHQSTSSPVSQAENIQLIDEQTLISPIPPSNSRQSRYLLPSPPVKAARESPKLAALHARLYLPSRLPLETLARSLVDASADPSPDFNNESLATLGHDLLTHYASEHLVCTYPRLPLTVIFAAMYAYVGPKTLAAMAREWGVEMAVAPGGEVDPGLLQFKRVVPGTDLNAEPVTGTARPNEHRKSWRKSVTSRIVYDNEFGDPVKEVAEPLAQSVAESQSAQGVTAEQASATFVRAVMGAIYLHAGRPAAKRFFEQHILSRHLNISDLFNFSQPARDLTRLCARENFEPPVAKIISETGRKSRHPVFVVGIFSGQDKLGEGAGASLLEARSRAAVAALKGWYLYSPLNVRVPSSMEEEGTAPWKPVHVDLGEVIV
ncbi:mitochondrial 54S ribosomal protein mL44 [Aspergillus clavatus NRRL 1]|uniref:Large ribosomal subunit protein mL44 n=1 Tax=Aspergillus clavatus (strain ATCC 1007 / CBS 513.65 / DSM 816 / NCTC 3887 / NRRL 1 / QM 1276 / 107) TaxID=344612 RepID=A1CPI9_ASPCL|nr:mitochondrial 54S ribosomal protein YmL3 [Aspergillus clavatus NRRL 1]EAW07560.1 60S ribosomal protein L3 [Aspergillus clavatus NRRL 1]